MIQLGQDRGEIRNDFRLRRSPMFFRQTIFGTLLNLVPLRRRHLHSRIETAFNLLWSGLAPRGDSVPPLPARLFTRETSFMSRKRILILLAAAAVLAATALYAGWFHRDTGLQGSGTVEARNIRVGSKIGGRIDKFWSAKATPSKRVRS